MAEFIRINAADNVAVAIHDVEAGHSFDIDGVTIKEAFIAVSRFSLSLFIKKEPVSMTARPRCS